MYISYIHKLSFFCLDLKKKSLIKYMPIKKFKRCFVRAFDEIVHYVLQNEFTRALFSLLNTPSFRK